MNSYHSAIEKMAKETVVDRIGLGSKRLNGMKCIKENSEFSCLVCLFLYGIGVLQ